jgi:hypothetical protein
MTLAWASYPATEERVRIKRKEKKHNLILR